jgi:predicted amidophosphoribosyltransferase
MAEPLGLALAILIKNKYPELLRADALIPVPQHDEKLEDVGFNQSQQLAVKLEKETGKPTLDMLLSGCREGVY